MPTKRLTGAAAVRRVGVNAGSIDSSSGSASVTPAPRKNVRRGICRFVRNIAILHAGPTNQARPTLSVRTNWRFRTLHAHLELVTSHDSQHDRGDAIVVLRDVARDPAHGRHVR